MDDLIRRFRDYQIEWLTAHNDIEFCYEEEKLLIGFLKDTAESFMRENQSEQQWIPCSERLPDIHEEVLICDSSVTQRVYTFTRISDDEVGWENDYGFYHSLRTWKHGCRCQNRIRGKQ